jgi:hypothetical protein
MLRIDNFNLRDAFKRWAEWNEKLRLQTEMNEVGPITEYVFEAKRTMYNLIDFMRSERYDEETIAYWVKHSVSVNDHQLNWLYKRLSIPRADREQLIRVMEHWKMWLGVKKLFRYHLQKANDSIQPIKCDMRWAFDHWRRADGAMAGYLDRHGFKVNKTMNIMQARVLDQQAEREAENSAVISHLNQQRDELLDKFLVAQRLGLSLFSANKRKDLEQSFSKWKMHCHEEAKIEGEAKIYEAV